MSGIGFTGFQGELQRDGPAAGMGCLPESLGETRTRRTDSTPGTAETLESEEC